MRLAIADAYRPDPDARVLRHSPLSEFLGAVALVAVMVGGGFAVIRMVADLPSLLWLVAGPIVLFTGLVLAVVTKTQLGSFFASLTRDNWLARVDRSGVALNLRSFRNRHFTGGGPTVVELDAAELAGVCEVLERRTQRRARSASTVRSRWIELHLRDRNTAALAEAVETERRHRETETHADGTTGSLKHYHVPVFVLRPGVLRIDRVAGLFEALAGIAEVLPRQELDLDAAFAGRPAEERAAELLLRGERIAAERILREELSLDDTEADRWIDGRAAA